MRRFVIATVVDATRSILATVIALLAIGGAVYIGVHPFGRFAYGCGDTGNSSLVCLILYHPTRLAWQVPVAVVVGLVGLGLAAAVAYWRRARRPERPLPISAEWPVRL